MEQHPEIAIIVAMSENRVIGRDNALPWQLRADLIHFKNITTPFPIIMGRKTHESIGRALPNRLNIVITRNRQFQAVAPSVTAGSVEEALIEAKRTLAEKIFIIGGEEIYKLALPQINTIYLTKVHAQINGDSYFPSLDSTQWQCISSQRFPADEQNEYDYSFEILRRY